ncbi:MAG: sigma-70 family RNA polymerase sigma factor, partial [Alphaproteobacteria bacterium]
MNDEALFTPRERQGRSFRGYVLRIGRQPFLSRAEEVALARRSRGGDLAAAARLITSHLRFVVRIARSYRGFGLPMPDLVQEGTIGLIKAVRRFNPDLGNRFATYAMWWIRAAIQEHVVRSWSLVRVGKTAAQKALFLHLKRLAAELVDGALRDDQVRQLALRFRLPVREVLAMAARAARRDRSLNAPVARDGVEEWVDQVPDTRPNAEEELAERTERRFWRVLIQRAMDKLSPRERVIIRRRYLSEAAATCEALGRELGLS